MKHLKKYNEAKASKNTLMIQELKDLCLPLKDLDSNIKINIETDTYTKEYYVIKLTREAKINVFKVTSDNYNTMFDYMRNETEIFSTILKEVNILIESIILRGYDVIYSFHYDNEEIVFILDVMEK